MNNSIKKYLWIACLCMSSICFAQQKNQDIKYEDLVNPLVGSDSKYSLSNGNTYPVIAMPWGMNFWTPQTGEMGSGWIYTYSADKIKGLKQTHQPSPWINDYGQFALMPATGTLKFSEEERGSWFSHKAEIAHPYYYSVFLADHNVTAEVSPTERAAAFRFTFPAGDSSYLVIDALDKGSFIEVLPGGRKVIGYSTKNSGGVPDNFKNYFELNFDQPIVKSVISRNGKADQKVNSATGEHVMVAVYFKLPKGGTVNVNVASSFISQAQASLNGKEIGNKTFDEVKESARSAWNEQLGKIKVEGGSIDQQRTFYSCLYRCLLFPRKFYEIDSAGQVVHYSPFNGKVTPGYLFTDTGFWDTFRSLFPFLNLVYPSMNAKMMKGLENTYKESGWLPEWASPGHRESMIGSNSASIITDAYLKGLRGFDINLLYEGLLKNAGNEGPISSVGRKGAEFYNRLGYVPNDVEIRGNVARTLEYAYDDFTLLQLSKALKRPEKETRLFAKRAQNYRNVFDKESGLVRGKNQKGVFYSPFDPFDWGPSFTEGNSWHWTWCVFHDIEGLKQLSGGNEKFVARLDTVFTLPPIVGLGGRKGQIHEMREMQVAGMGQYAHGNQPIQHMPYLYNYAGQPWKSQYWVREIMNRLYLPTPDGYCGDEDNGQTSAWYVFSAMGFYPVTPGTDQYVMGSPLFKKVTIALENGKHIVISAPENNADNRYIKKLTLNGKVYPFNWLSHKELSQGAVLDIDMSPVPEKNRGIRKQDYPFSFSGK
ncbi:GH92 family glycosyl hydrolase [Pedobacter sp. AW31-3R]|uniref:GH92 family glycosyl hydrolase n=1 Tax=Pedobacter sp. AW31-3R TaxID=3445781 RepID=UPI003F9F5615